MSLATLDRRVVPVIKTVKTEWGARLIPVDELERFLAERRRDTRTANRSPERAGRKTGIDPDLVARIRREYAKGRSLAEIARRLNVEGVRTAQGGRQWWPSTVRSVLARAHPAASAGGG
jgi:recombinase